MFTRPSLLFIQERSPKMRQSTTSVLSVGAYIYILILDHETIHRRHVRVGGISVHALWPQSSNHCRMMYIAGSGMIVCRSVFFPVVFLMPLKCIKRLLKGGMQRGTKRPCFEPFADVPDDDEVPCYRFTLVQPGGCMVVLLLEEPEQRVRSVCKCITLYSRGSDAICPNCGRTGCFSSCSTDVWFQLYRKGLRMIGSEPRLASMSRLL